jgi:5'-nucleotidase
MTQSAPPLILVTNDDGIDSPGLAAACAALAPLGELLIIAPLHQQTSAGRSRPGKVVKGGLIVKRPIQFQDQTWDGFAVDGTPAVAVDHGVLELADRPIALAVSGINYGENVSTCVTVSGTVGAALQAAEYGIPSMAVSLALAEPDYYSHDLKINFSPAVHFARFFAERFLRLSPPADVDVLKVEVPVQADVDTRWVVTRLDRLMYYQANFSTRKDIFTEPTELKLTTRKGEYNQEGTDAHALAQGWVSVTPLSLDLTSRVDLHKLREMITEDDMSHP